MLNHHRGVPRTPLLAGLLAGAVLAAFAASKPAADAGAQAVPINFARGTLAGAGFATNAPTSLTFGPDGRLFVSDLNGRIQALTIDAATQEVTNVEQIASASDLPFVLGIAFSPRDGKLYVSTSVLYQYDTPNPQYFSGKVLRVDAPGVFTEVITGLPTGQTDHGTNGLAFDASSRLYIAQGGTTNAGIVSFYLNRDESPLSGAILRADTYAPGFDGDVVYDDPVPRTTQNKIGGDVSVFAAGFRNPYDLVFHSNGKLYATDNGADTGLGDVSLLCDLDGGDPGEPTDELNVIVQGDYYGHPSRNRGRLDPRQCQYRSGESNAGSDFHQPLAPIPSSSNGIAEYTAYTFEGQLRGDLLYATFNDGTLRRVELDATGDAVVSNTLLADSIAGALDVAISPQGSIYVAAEIGSYITFLVPDESSVTDVTVTSIYPASGPIAGGTEVTISGTNFTTTGDTTVTVGGVPLTNLVVQNSTLLTGTTGATDTPGQANVAATNSVGTGVLVGGYNYVDPSAGQDLPPTADAGPDVIAPVAHEIHAHVTLDGRGSSDADGYIVAYEWTRDGEIISTAPVDSVEFTEGVWDVTLTITDNDGHTDTDTVQVTITNGAANPERFYCFDVNGDGKVTSVDLQMVAQAFGSRYGDAAYERRRDFNGDRLIASADLAGTAQDFTPGCPLVDRQIRIATLAMEPYIDINAAYAAGYHQVTQYFPGAGLHLVKDSLKDSVFDPGQPEGLLYAPDGHGGWRLGGAMYWVPTSVSPLVPDGFSTFEDAWHYHENICFYPAGIVTPDDRATCEANGGYFEERFGWLVHLWNYWYNPLGRFVEINERF